MVSLLGRDRIYQCCGGEYPPPSTKMKEQTPTATALHMGRVYLCLGSPIMSCPVRKQMTLLLEHQ